MSDEVKLDLEGYLFTWVDDKEKANLRKHGVTFRLAAEVFFDDYSVRIFDELHSNDEDRYQIIGTTKWAYKVLFVVYVERTTQGNKDLYRIISARDANKKEMELYGMGLPRGLSAYEGGSIEDSYVR